ncbi:hypothetical protein RP20_CCG026042 [Aedes albopictus]|nr:hypothetical protein RP20_CCG026042 [Aedes albopictus]
MERILVLFLLRFIITFTNLPQVELQAIGTDCNGKKFICIDSNRFQVCADVPGARTETTDDVTHVCALDTFCYNDGMVECDSTTLFDEMALTETGDTLTISNNADDSEMSNLGGGSTTSGISNLNTLTVSSSSSSDTTQEGTEDYPLEDSNLSDTTNMTEMASTDFSASSNISPESPMSTLDSEYTEMRFDAAVTDGTPATFENSANEDLDAVIQPTSTEKRFFCELPGSYPHESNCHKYYVCVQRPYGFIRFEVSCYFNMAFDPALHRCVFSQRACHPTREAFVCPSDGKFPDPSGSDGKYYWCVENGTDYLMYQMRCPYGQRFNADVGQCQDWSGPDVVITSGGMQTVIVDDSGDSSSESEDSDDSNE